MEHEELDQITKELEDFLNLQPKTLEKPEQTEQKEDAEKQSEEIKQPTEPIEEKLERRNRKKFEFDYALLAACLMPILIMLVIFVQRGIFPFGEESFLRTDMYHQYAPFFSEFQYKLKHGGSLLYSWDIGMGVNFAALYAYYLASPLNWLILLCPKSLVIEFMTYSIVVKTGLCGLTMAYYLRKHGGPHDFGAAIFGVFYAMSGYMAAYSWNIMWLDCILLFPLIMLGLERLVRDGKGMLYGIALGISIFSNYYISIMICIFMVLYFIALLVLESEMDWERFITRCFQFAGYSLLAGGIAAIVLIPEIYALQMTASGDFNFPKTFTQYFPIFDMIARHIGNVQSEIGLDHWPNIYCGVAVLMLIPLYFAQKRIPGKEKAVYGTLVLFLLASFSINVLNFIWHGFHYPNSLPCRQSFIYIFLILLMCYRAYSYLKETAWKTIAGAFWGAVIFVLMAQKLVTQDDFHFMVYYGAILFLGLYLAAVWIYKKGAKYSCEALFFALTVAALEAGINMAVTSVTTTSRTAYKSDNEAVSQLMDTVLPAEEFFRVDKVTRKTKNDGAWMNFPSVSLFSSTANADLSSLFKKLGCESSTNAYSITGATPLIDMLFSVKYGIYSEKPEDTSMRRMLADTDETWLYENTYTLPLGFWVPSDFETQWHVHAGNPADVQNSLADVSGADPVLEVILDATSEGKSMTFYPEVGGEYFAYVSNKKIEKVRIETWKGTKTYDNVDRGYLLDLGYCAVGEPVTLTAEDSKESMWADVYRFSETALADIYETWNQSSWKLNSWTDTSLSGMITCSESGWMFTTIPYDEGWKITVDGVEQTNTKMMDAFIGVRLTPGSHTVEMTYRPKGLIPGMTISAVSVLIFLIIGTVGWISRKRQWEE